MMTALWNSGVWIIQKVFEAEYGVKLVAALEWQKFLEQGNSSFPSGELRTPSGDKGRKGGRWGR